MRRFVFIPLVSSLFVAVGCVQVEDLHYHHDNPETYNGPVDQGTEVHEVNVDEVDVDTDVDAEVNADVDAEGSVALEGDPASDAEPHGGTTAVGEGVAFEYLYQGPIDERADLRPSATELAVDSVEWLLVDVVRGAPTVFDDAEGFDWGEPQYEDGTYVLATRFGDEALAPFVWDTTTRLCDAGGCHGRAISAACRADVVMRVWLTDGSSLDARAVHESARPACW